MILPGFSDTRRRAYRNGEEIDPPANESIWLRVAGDRPQTVRVPYSGMSQEFEIEATNAPFSISEENYARWRSCEGFNDIPPPFRGGQCRIPYFYEVTWWDRVRRESRSSTILQQGPLVPLSFDSDGVLNMDGQLIIGGGPDRKYHNCW